ncbi:MAG TPA: copper-binding protein [Lacunisphaera sp.]|nr:copper-binding protein [Lacunisphaera sp.]
MKSLSVLLVSLLTAALPAAGKSPTCDCGRECGKDGAACCCATAAAEKPDAPSHALKGVVKSLLPEKSALLVKHEEVPGVMRAMTMMFKVEPSVLERVKAGDAIEALMSKRADGWWLSEVKVLATAKN